MNAWSANDFAPHVEDEQRRYAMPEGYIRCNECHLVASATAPASGVCDSCYARTLGDRESAA